MTHYGAGAVWWAGTDFRDGKGERKKYFVLLTDCEAAGELFLFAVTTSKADRHYSLAATSASPCGCPALNFFRIEAGQEVCFPATTWVEFNNGGHIGRQDLDDMVKQGRAGFVQMLSPERLRSLLNCAKKSQDIAKRDLERIDQALKARNPSKKTPPSGPTTKNPPAPLVDPALDSVRARMDRYCVKCRSEFIELVGIEALKLTTILQGQEKVPDGFLANTETGFDLVPSCDSCSK